MTGVTVAGHTPGPWRVDEAGDIVSGPYNVAILYATKSHDKQLMAAAPDLLAALQTVIRELFPHATPGEYPELRDARASIARATGEASHG